MNSLQALLAQAEGARDAAERELRLALAALRSAETQRRELIDYRGQYEARYAAQFARSATGIDVVRCYQAFMARLAQAIEQQSHSVRQHEARLEAARQLLHRCEARASSIRSLMARRAEELQRHAARRDQRQADEAVAQRAAQRPSSMMPLGFALRGARGA